MGFAGGLVNVRAVPHRGAGREGRTRGRGHPGSGAEASQRPDGFAAARITGSGNRGTVESLTRCHYKESRPMNDHDASAPTRLRGEAWFAVLVLVGHIAALTAGIIWAMGGF